MGYSCVDGAVHDVLEGKAGDPVRALPLMTSLHDAASTGRGRPVPDRLAARRRGSVRLAAKMERYR